MKDVTLFWLSQGVLPYLCFSSLIFIRPYVTTASLPERLRKPNQPCNNHTI